MVAGLDVSVEIVQCFAFYAAVVLFKVLLMAPLTGMQRFRNKAFANPEDAKRHGGTTSVSEGVERVRRAHLNDLENVIPFVLLGLLYVFTAAPSFSSAKLHFQIFTASRLAHTVVYVGQVPQPARALTFFVGMAVCVSMGLQVIF